MEHTSEANLILTAMAFLLVKHALADFLLQTEYQRSTKGTYGAPGGIIHSALHIALTAPVSAHVLGRAAYFVGVPLWEGTQSDELRDRYDREDHTLVGEQLALPHMTPPEGEPEPPA